MSDIVKWLRSGLDWPTGTEAGMREAAAEIERLTELADSMSDALLERDAEIERHLREKVELAGLVAKERDEVERLRAALQALHDWNVEYARINNLFNDDGTPATFHELLEARRALEPKP